MGFEMPVDVDYFDHPKTLRLIALVGRQEADIYPLRLWKWAAKYARTGVIYLGAPAIEAACGWRGTPGKLHKALVEAEFIEKDGITIHDWMDGIGRSILIYERKKQKQRDKYAATHGILPEERGKKHPYPGGDTREWRGGETQDSKSRRGGDNRPPSPPDQAPPGTTTPPDVPTEPAEPQGDVIPLPARTGGEQEIDPYALDLEAFADFRTPGARHKREAFEDLVRQGVSHERIREAAREHGDWDFYEVVKALRNGRGKQGQGRPNPPKAPPGPPRTETQRKLDEARAAVDAKLAELPAETIAEWTRQAEEEAKANKVHPENMRLAVTTALRIRAAKEFGIEGV